MSTQVTNEKVDKKYYVVLMLVHMGNSVWLVPQDNGSLAWTNEFCDTQPFLSYEEAKSVVESHFLQTFGFIGSYKIIELTYEELLDFEILTDN